MVRELEFARLKDGNMVVGFSNETEAGGFTVWGYVNKALAPYVLIEEVAELVEAANGASIAALGTIADEIRALGKGK